MQPSEVRPEVVSGRFKLKPKKRTTPGHAAIETMGTGIGNRINEMSVEAKTTLLQLLDLVQNEELQCRVQVFKKSQPGEARGAAQNLYMSSRDQKAFEDEEERERAEHDEKLTEARRRGQVVCHHQQPKLDANIVPTAESILVDIPGVTLPTGISCSPIQATYGKRMFLLLEEAGYEIRGQRNRIRSLQHTPTTWTLDAETIIMADSQLGSRGYNGYCDRATVTIVCPGARAVELIKFAESARECFPGVSTVVVMAGTNDYLKKVGKAGTKNKQEASMIATQISQDIVNALELYRGGEYRMAFAATPKFGEKERGVFLGDFLETLEHTLNWTFPEGRTQSGVLMVALKGKFGSAEQVQGDVHLPVSQIPDYVAKVGMKLQQLDVRAPQLTNNVNGALSLRMFADKHMRAALEGLSYRERQVRAKAILEAEELILGPRLCTVDWKSALQEPIPAQCKGLLAQQAAAMRESATFKQLVASRQKVSMPRMEVCPVGSAEALARHAPRMKEFLTFIQEVEAVSTPAEFEVFMSGRFQEHKTSDLAPPLQCTWSGRSPYELFAEEGSPWNSAMNRGFRHGVHMRELCWYDILAACILVGPRKLEMGPQAVEQEFDTWNKIYALADGQVAVIAAFMSEKGIRFFFEKASAAISKVKEHRDICFRALAYIQSQLERPLVLADLALHLGVQPQRVDVYITCHKARALLGELPQEPAVLPPRVMREIPQMFHVVSYIAGQPVRCSSTANQGRF